jgi:hypothetical protein
MEEFYLDIRLSFKFKAKAESEESFWGMESEELRSLVYANLPGKTVQSPRDIDEIEILNIEKQDDGNTIAFPGQKKRSDENGTQ